MYLSIYQSLAISLNFPRETQEFTEGSGRRDIAVSLGTEVQYPITVQVTGGNNCCCIDVHTSQVF